MKIDKAILWNILEKYDCKEYKSLCDGLSNIIKDKASDDDLINIFTFYDKIDNSDRVLIDNQIGNEISYILFCV